MMNWRDRLSNISSPNSGFIYIFLFTPFLSMNKIFLVFSICHQNFIKFINGDTDWTVDILSQVDFAREFAKHSVFFATIHIFLQSPV